jgi:hypothetical protein
LTHGLPVVLPGHKTVLRDAFEFSRGHCTRAPPPQPLVSKDFTHAVSVMLLASSKELLLHGLPEGGHGEQAAASWDYGAGSGKPRAWRSVGPPRLRERAGTDAQPLVDEGVFWLLISRRWRRLLSYVYSGCHSSNSRAICRIAGESGILGKRSVGCGAFWQASALGCRSGLPKWQARGRERLRTGPPKSSPLRRPCSCQTRVPPVQAGRGRHRSAGPVPVGGTV